MVSDPMSQLINVWCSMDKTLDSFYQNLMVYGYRSDVVDESLRDLVDSHETLKHVIRDMNKLLRELMDQGAVEMLDRERRGERYE